jgi:hypothetical protein
MLTYVFLTGISCRFCSGIPCLLSSGIGCRFAPESPVTTEANDQNQLEPMIETTEKNTGKKVKEAKLDSGYASYDNYKILK